MHLSFLRYILCTCLLICAFYTWASKDPGLNAHQTNAFEERTLLKKGILLSELGLSKDSRVKIKHNNAMRFDAAYTPPPPGGGKPAYMTIEEIKKHILRAHASLQSVQARSAFTALLEGKNIELPVGIKKTIGNKDVIVCLDSIIFTPTYGFATLYVIIEDTKNDKELVFYGSNIRFTKDGGFTGDGRLDLLETYDLDFGQTAKVSFVVDETHENYVVFDCDGFKKLHVDATVFFSRTMFVPENEDGTINEADQVTTDFMADFQSLDNFIVQLSNVPAFQVVGMEGTSFKINTLAFDYSSELNPTDIAFPEDYDYPAFANGGDHNYWEGFYIDGLTIKLPEEFKLKNNTSGRITFNVNQAMIDKLGFTGNINAENIIALRDGDMSGWDYSLDVIDVTFLKSSLTEAQFSGSLVIPITKSDQQLDYTAIIQPGHKYNFTVALASNLNIPMWGAGGVSLEQDSWINVQIANKKFTPTASLNGTMSIGAPVNGEVGQAEDGDDNSKLALAQIKFVKLLVSTQSPYISLDKNGGSFGFESPALNQKMAKLPIGLKHISLKTQTNPDLTGVNFTVTVNLTKKDSDDAGISGNATFTVWGKNNYNNGKTSYSFYKVQLDRVELNGITVAVVTLGGSIEFFRQDPNYGSGFSGKISIGLEIGQKTVGIESQVIFGKMSSTKEEIGIYRYWAVDMLFKLPMVIPVFPAIVSLNSVGGGVSNRMNIDHSHTVKNAKFVTSTGIAYLPDETKGLGIKVLLGIQGPSRKAYEGQLIFEVLFQPGGGIAQVSFSGYVKIANFSNDNPFDKVKSSMAGLVDKIKNNPSSVYGASNDPSGEIYRQADGGAIMAQWMMVYDRTNSSFIATLDLFVDIFGIIKGVNPTPPGHAGQIGIKFSKEEWYVYAGVPAFPAGLNVIDVVDISSYFMVGTKIYPPLPMPFPGAPTGNPFTSDLAKQTTLGNGFAAGVRLHVDSKGGGFFYYACRADAGLDFAVWNVEGQYCNGKPKGIKGWYGMGRGYFYAMGSAGLVSFTIGLPYPCYCDPCKTCKRCWGPWCFGCDWCQVFIRADLSATIDLGFYGDIEAANPTNAKGGFGILGHWVKVEKGKSCN